MQNRVERPPDLPAHKFSALKAEKLADGFSLTIPKQMYQKRIAEFKFSVIGRVLLRKGSKPQATHQLKLELNNLWGIQSEWKLLTLGKGFFTMKFSTLEDKKLAKTKIVWDLAAGSIRLRDWVPCFNPYKEVSSICQVWVRIYYLPNEFWDPKVITAIARIIGFCHTPILE
ncbi:uncharacterized protein LOC130990655 [Salvia miltiorrhiza]|uniref:uncharacterized protein LOC130990655 n=1 Tax=Salvia miltiorrhiza TaxID=226208 RepID=UPI0025AC0515|nr:uncharacterized protein LOC130990655 [Salvia miltiorrhiza]